MIAVNGLDKKVCDHTPNVFEKIVAKLHSFFCFLKSSYKTLILVAIVAIASVVITTLVSMMLSYSDSEVFVSSFGTIKTIGIEIY